MELIRFGSSVLNNYLLSTKKGLILVDTGYEKKYDSFKKNFCELGYSINDIKYIVLTHAHDDHAGFLDELGRTTGAKIVLHSLAVDRLKKGQNEPTGSCPSRLSYLYFKLSALIEKGLNTFPPVHLEQQYLVFNGTEQFFEDIGLPVRIVHLPGHTADSIGLLLNDGRMLCGDAVMNGFPSIKRCIIMIEDKISYGQSWDKMIQLGVKILLPTHGKEFPVEDLVKYRKYIDKIKLIPFKHS